jgi:hypothetical protein
MEVKLVMWKRRFTTYCASGQWDHANEFVIPGVSFYITGWIGWVGRKYVRYASTTKNPFENEIIINACSYWNHEFRILMACGLEKLTVAIY